MSQHDVVRIHVPEQVVPDRRLGRHVVHDPASKNFVAEQAPQIVSVKHAAVGLPLDQGQIGSCTANALCGARNSSPDKQPNDPMLSETDAVKLYELETKMEGKPYPPNDPGGSGLEVCKAAVQLGLISRYTHAFGIDQALKALVLRPVISGIAWYDSFDHFDPTTGLVELKPGAKVRGGHEIVADEIDAPNKLVWWWNSWGTAFGLGGRFCMSWDTWDQLLQDKQFPGDCTVPIR
jgi:hypothetical protein